MRTAVFTLGCKVNQYESGAIVTALRELGLEADEGLFAADLYVINTCSVTAEADKKSRQAVSRALKFNPAAKIIIVGCSSQNDSTRFLKRPAVKAVFGTGGKIANIVKAVTELMHKQHSSEGVSLKPQSGCFHNTKKLELSGSSAEIDNLSGAAGVESLNKNPNIAADTENLNINLNGRPDEIGENFDKNPDVSQDEVGTEKFRQNKHSLPRVYEDDMTPTQSKTRGHVKIQDGCDNFCAYCRVPYLRGRSRSRGEDAVISEALRFARTSKEIVLTGIDISSYGKNIGSSLPRLVAALGAALRENEMLAEVKSGCRYCENSDDCGIDSCSNHNEILKNRCSCGTKIDGGYFAGTSKAFEANRISEAGKVSEAGKNFASCAKNIARRTRIRLGSLECNVIDDELLEAMRDYDFCDHFHLSLQSGSDSVLKRMNRHYSTTEFLDKVNLIRKYFPYAGITTDVIVGFPEESIAEYEETAAFLHKIGFSDVHVFPYSPRRGTSAYALPQLDKTVREERARGLSAIAAGLKLDFIKRNLGRVCEVLAEDGEDGFVTGFTSNYIKVYTKLASGEMRAQRLVETFGAGVRGENPN